MTRRASRLLRQMIRAIPRVNFRGEKRSNETHESKTDPDSLLARKSGGKESRLSYRGNLLMENRIGLIVDAEVFQANATAERDAALVMMERLPGTQPLTVGGDKRGRHVRVCGGVPPSAGDAARGAEPGTTRGQRDCIAVVMIGDSILPWMDGTWVIQYTQISGAWLDRWKPGG